MLKSKKFNIAAVGCTLVAAVFGLTAFPKSDKVEGGGANLQSEPVIVLKVGGMVGFSLAAMCFSRQSRKAARLERQLRRQKTHSK
jgi:hypothetical protein